MARRLPPLVPPGAPGPGLLRLDGWGTLAFVVTAVAAAAAPGWFRWPALVVALATFAVGFVAFVAAFGVAASRSRFEAVTTPGVYFLSGSAPGPVRGRFWGLVAVQTVVAVATASVRPFTSLAFGILVPTFGLGLMAMWGSRHGSFPERPARSGR